MTWKCWTPSWTNPGSRKVDSVLNLIVNRNLTVKGKIITSTPSTGWIQYTPTVMGYNQTYGNAFAPGVPATGMVYTAVGRYYKLGNIVFFNLYVNVTNRGNCVSDLDIDLPPYVSASHINAVGTTQATGNINWTNYAGLTGWAAPNLTRIRAYLSSRAAAANTGLCQSYTTGAFDIYLGGQYESTV